MNTNQIISRMNELEIGIQEVKIIYNESIRELIEKQFQLRNELPLKIDIIEIDKELLIERALLIGTPLSKRLLKRFRENLKALNKMEQATNSHKLKSEMAPQLLKSKSDVKLAGHALFRAVFGDTKRYRLLDIHTIGENVHFGYE